MVTAAKKQAGVGITQKRDDDLHGKMKRKRGDLHGHHEFSTTVEANLEMANKPFARI